MAEVMVDKIGPREIPSVASVHKNDDPAIVGSKGGMRIGSGGNN